MWIGRLKQNLVENLKSSILDSQSFFLYKKLIEVHQVFNSSIQHTLYDVVQSKDEEASFRPKTGNILKFTFDIVQP